MKLLDLPDANAKARRALFIQDDFVTYVDGGVWTKLAADATSAVAAGDTENGVVTLTTGGTDNNEAALSTTKKVFKFGDDKPHVAEALVQYAEANTDDANVFFGFISAAAANTLVDDGAGPATNFDGAGFYKVDGGTNWNIIVSNATTQTTVQLNAANSLTKAAVTAGGSAQQKLRIEFKAVSSTKGEVSFYVDDVLVYKVSDWTFPTNVMYLRAYIKAGGANSEVLSVDLIQAGKLR